MHLKATSKPLFDPCSADRHSPLAGEIQLKPLIGNTFLGWWMYGRLHFHKRFMKGAPSQLILWENRAIKTHAATVSAG